MSTRPRFHQEDQGGWEPGEIHFLENLLVPGDEKLRGQLQLVGVVEVSEVEHIHHVLSGEQLHASLLQLDLGQNQSKVSQS